MPKVYFYALKITLKRLLKNKYDQIIHIICATLFKCQTGFFSYCHTNAVTILCTQTYNMCNFISKIEEIVHYEITYKIRFLRSAE